MAQSSPIKGLVPRSGIDTDARWGFGQPEDSGCLVINYT